jgi:hypothetical protein
MDCGQVSGQKVKAMRVLLRDRKTNLFWGEEGRWTANAATARDFGSSTRAIQFALAERMNEVEVVLSFPNPLYDITLPVNPASSGEGLRPEA